MNDEQKGELIRAMTHQILNCLMKQDFADWYAGRFEAYVTGDLEDTFGTSNSIVAEALIMQDIQRLFKLV